jgi:hypothetical protein
MEVICFGHIFFEMALGFPLTEEKQQDPNFFATTIQPMCSPQIYSVHLRTTSNVRAHYFFL